MNTDTAPQLLNDDGTASMATALMMSHHGLRRDLRCFAAALLAQPDAERLPALADAWQSFRQTLHGHHQAEDAGIFPELQAKGGSIAQTIEGLAADHRRIDPMLEQGDAAFAALGAGVAPALALVRELQALLHQHLAIEEAEVVPYLREAKAFPAPPNEEAAQMYAQGFSWAMHGIAPEVIERLHVMLPSEVVSRLPVARRDFEARWHRTWGDMPLGAAMTPIPV